VGKDIAERWRFFEVLKDLSHLQVMLGLFNKASTALLYLKLDRLKDSDKSLVEAVKLFILEGSLWSI
jgi:hypothetical protein